MAEDDDERRKSAKPIERFHVIALVGDPSLDHETTAFPLQVRDLLPVIVLVDTGLSNGASSRPLTNALVARVWRVQ